MFQLPTASVVPVCSSSLVVNQAALSGSGSYRRGMHPRLRHQGPLDKFDTWLPGLALQVAQNTRSGPLCAHTSLEGSFL